MQTVFILVNSVGILLGVYRTYESAISAIELYEKNDSISGEPIMYLYKVTSGQVDARVNNNFSCVWTNDL